MFNSQTLTAGGKITSADHVISMATDGHALVIDSSTMNLEQAYVVGTQTLVPGGQAITVGNTVMSLEPGKGDGEGSLVIGVSMTEGVGSPAAVTAGGSVISVGLGSQGGTSMVTELSVTVDVSLLTATGSQGGTAPSSGPSGETTTGVRASGKSSSSARLSVCFCIRWQTMLSVIIISAFM